MMLTEFIKKIGGFAAAFFLLMCVCIVAGCASGSAANITDRQPAFPPAAATVPDIVVSWKYSGFGKKRPDWLQSALAGDFTSLQASFPGKASRTVVLVYARGTNLDNAEGLVDIYPVEKKHPELGGITLFDETWIKIRPTDEKAAVYYIAARLYSAVGRDTSGFRCIVLDAE
jgi:hypothetical protein